MSEMPLEPEWGGCPWPVDPGCLTDEWLELDDDLKERSIMLASTSLEALTAYRVGNCSVTVRPCAQRCCTPPGGWMNPSIKRPGVWVNGCGCTSGCACTTSCEVELPGPIGRIDQVKVDGIALDLNDVRIDNGNILVWQGGGECPFKLDQNLSLPDTEVGTFSVTYLNAYEPDRQAALAVAYLAMEFAKACKPKGKCALPRGVTNVVRSGVSFTIEAGLFPNGSTNIEIVDAFIQRWNPNNKVQQSRVLVPGKKSIRVTQTINGGAP